MSSVQNNNIKKFRQKHIKNYIVISYILAIIILGIMFRDSVSIENIYSYNFYILIMLGLILLVFVRYLKSIKILSTPSWKNYFVFAIFISGLTALIYFNEHFDSRFIKIYYFIPLILGTVNFGKRFGYFTAILCTVSLGTLNYLNTNFNNLNSDIIVIILFYWVAWVIGGFIDMERNIQKNLNNMIKEEKRLKQEKHKNLKKAKDLTRKLNKVNKDLRESQRLFKLNFEESNVGMAICDLNFKFIKINKALSKMLGYTREELKEKKTTDLIVEEDLNKYSTQNVQMNYNRQYTTNLVLRYHSKEGNIVWIRENITLVKDDNDEPVYYLKQMEDITRKKEAEKQIQEQKEKLEYNKIKTRFFAKVSHELKTPLNLILTSLHMLNKKFAAMNIDEDFNGNRYIRLIKQNSYRLLRLVNNIIDLTKIDSNTFELNIANVDIVKIMKEIIDSTSDYVENKNRNFTFNCHIDKRVIACDPFNIERIMLNLISNAVKFTDENDYIIIEIDEDKMEEHIIITVEDTGIGIKKEKLNMIFEQFRQVDESFTRNNEGSGIGLSIVKSIVELHDGDILVESEFGEGTKFTISLPIKTVEDEDELEDQEINSNLIDKISVEFSDIYNI